MNTSKPWWKRRAGAWDTKEFRMTETQGTQGTETRPEREGNDKEFEPSAGAVKELWGNF